MDTVNINLSTEQEAVTRRRLLPRWREIGWLRRIARVVWLLCATFFAVTLTQVVLGKFINPPVTPLMIGRFFEQVADSNRPVRFKRDYVSIKRISPNLITAVVYAEDGLFMQHHGFDVKQMKIAYRENQQGKRVRGGSTISNQTAKNAFLPHSRSMLRKAVEAYYTVLIEAIWGKRRIMEVYLNIIEFGDGIYGCEAAAKHYFGHSANELSRNEAAQLAATLPAPLKRNPAMQTPFFKKQTQTIKQRFNWGVVDINKPTDKKNKKGKKRETLIDFLIWRIQQKH